MIQNKNTSLIVSAVLIIFLIGCFIRPLFLSIKKNSAALIIQKATLAEREKKNENFKEFQSTYETYRLNLDKIDQLFIDREEPIEFIEFLEKEAGRNKLSIDLTPLSLRAVAEDVWPSINFQVAAAGSFQNFLKFLDKIESSPHLIVLSDFSLNKPAKDTNGDIVVSFQMKVYAQ
ncbi:MAG: type 4a pilus biogenesis protein PilO [Candidatus Nealsonbacteria bacterium]